MAGLSSCLQTKQMSQMGHLRKYGACWPNDRYLIRKQPLAKDAINGRSWPILAICYDQ
jgi:hypothetical protein